MSEKIKLTAEELAAFREETAKHATPEQLAELDAATKQYLTDEAADAAAAEAKQEEPARSETPAPPSEAPIDGLAVLAEEPIESPVAELVKTFTPDQQAVYRTLDGAGRARMDKLLL
jgi:hypothetical protein